MGLERWFWKHTVRPIAGDAERRAVEELRYRVYVQEMGKPYPEADHVAQRLSDPLDDGSLILGAFDGGTLVGTVRSTTGEHPRLSECYGAGLQLDEWSDVPPRSLLICSRLVVEPRMRRTQRASLALMCATYYFGRENGITVCLCSTIEPLVTYFERFGFRRYGVPFLDAGADRLQLPLGLLVEDADYIAAIKSPFATEAAERVNPRPRQAWVDRLQASPGEMAHLDGGTRLAGRHASDARL
jgi:predicted GNAT family N-acyltransferase